MLADGQIHANIPYLHYNFGVLEQMAKIAPLGQWLRIGLAALLITLGIIGLAHLYIVIRAYGERDLRPLSPGMLMTVTRWTVFMFTSGLSIWGFDLHWPVVLMAGLAIAGTAAAAGETIARIRGGLPPRI